MFVYALNTITQITIVRDEKCGAGITVCWHSQIPTSAPLPSFVLTSYEPSFTVGNYTRDERTYICDGWTNSYEPYFETRKIEVATTAGIISVND